MHVASASSGPIEVGIADATLFLVQALVIWPFLGEVRRWSESPAVDL